MVETYTYVGNSPSWVLALLPVPVIIAFAIKQRAMGKRPFAWWQAVAILWFLVGSVAGLPQEWIYGGACFGGAVAVLLLKPKADTPKALRWVASRWILCPLYVAIGIFWVMMPSGFPHRIWLGDSNVTQAYMDRTETVPRTGVSMTFGESRLRWFTIRPGGYWFVHSDDRPGPEVSGHDIFWGPHGLTNGDALGEHLAAWANVKPRNLFSSN